jgi:DNA-binding GntR family transcriptional regulator
MQRNTVPAPKSDETIGIASARLHGHRVAEQLREDILSGVLPPGSRLRQEELAERLGLSRIPIREALKQLEAEGLVLMVPNSGAWVAKVDLQECVRIYKVRERVEPLALAESLVFLTEADIAELEALATAIEEAPSVEEFIRLDRQFHLASYRRSPLPMLHQLVEGFWNRTQHYRRAYMTAIGESKRWVTLVEHRLLIEAIRNRDPEEGERILLGHIRRTRVQLAGNSELFRGT